MNTYPEQPQADTVILALGNPLRGDDGAGPAVLEALRQVGNLPPGVALLDGDSRDLWSVLLTEHYRRVIVVDAVEMGRAPGEWAWFTPREDVFADSDAQNTLHDANLPDILALSNALDLPIPEIVVCGVQPLNVDWSEGLSEPVRETIPHICVAILTALAEPEFKVPPRKEISRG